MKYRLAIFDFDGTLTSSLDGINTCRSDALTTFGYRAPALDDVRATGGLRLEESVQIFYKTARPGGTDSADRETLSGPSRFKDCAARDAV